MNQLTPEQLDMIKRLQPKIREAMGDARKGDDYIWLHTMEQDVILSDFQAKCASDGVSFLLIPKPIDWQNPERGLWGMIDWQKFYANTYTDAKIVIQKRPRNEHDFDALEIRFMADPFTALLKALVQQEGV